jgi:putative SOS response-associated peptidase YedK
MKIEFAPHFARAKCCASLATLHTDVFGFLTTRPNAEVAKVHPQAMPVILTTNDDCDLWMTGDWEKASKLQRPLADGSLKIVMSGEKEDFG